MFTNQSKGIAQELEAIDEIATQVSKSSERYPLKAYQAVFSQSCFSFRL